MQKKKRSPITSVYTLGLLTSIRDWTWFAGSIPCPADCTAALSFGELSHQRLLTDDLVRGTRAVQILHVTVSLPHICQEHTDA